jgi:hypothetical protein
LQNLKTELQVREQQISVVSPHSGSRLPAKHDIRRATDTIHHSAEAVINHSSPRVRPGVFKANSLDL